MVTPKQTRSNRRIGHPTYPWGSTGSGEHAIERVGHRRHECGVLSLCEFKSDIELPEMWQAKERCAARKERKALGIADQTTEIPTEKGCPETPVSTWMVRTRSPRNRKQLASLRGDAVRDRTPKGMVRAWVPAPITMSTSTRGESPTLRTPDS